MRRAGAVLAVLVLAGCTGGGDEPVAQRGLPSSSSATSALEPTLPAQPTLTDTLHLLGAGLTSLLAPAEGEAAATAIPLNVGVPEPPRAVWTYDATANGSLESAEASVWVRLTQPVVSPGEGPLCAIELIVQVFEPGEETGVGITGALCGRLPAAAQPGDYQLEMDTSEFLLAPIALRAGMRVEVQVSRYAAGPAAADHVFLLGGSAEFDSWVKVAGLAEPMPPLGPGA